ncbi:MAG: DUF2339 domain-containing protein, partial [Proteobacteria bacterium]|nr:DUF2339 domain-containing protein [Burkholderiales bacterium]
MWLPGMLVGVFAGAWFGPMAALALGLIGCAVGGLIGSIARSRRDDELRALRREVARLRERLRVFEVDAVGAAASSTRSEATVASAQPGAVATSTADTTGAPTSTSTSTAPPPLYPDANPRPAAWSNDALDGATASADFVAPVSTAARIDAWLPFEGNWVARIGGLLLLIGVGFALNYAWDHLLVSWPMRLFTVALVAGSVFVLGERFRAQRPAYAEVVQGVAVGIGYLDIYVAHAVALLIGPGPALGAFVVLGAASLAWAVRREAPVLATLAATGAFLAPLLVDSPSSAPLPLFGYYALVNALVLGASLQRAWRGLNLLGFGFTAGVGVLWGLDQYEARHYPVVQAFLIGFFLLYATIPVLFARRVASPRVGWVDGTLVFGAPLLAWTLQYAIAEPLGERALAVSAGALALFYALGAFVLARVSTMRLLAHAHAFLAALFFALAVLFAVDAYPTFLLWSVQGALLVWLGLRQGERAVRATGYLMQLAAAGYFVVVAGPAIGQIGWLDAWRFGCIVIALAAFVSALLVERAARADR